MQFPHLLLTYLNKVTSYDQNNIQKVIKSLAKLNPHESCLIYLYDKDESDKKQKERMLAAKYIEMEMAVNNLKGVYLAVVDKKAAV